jgi:type II secretory pathway pseudopilin PulG
MRLGFSAHTHPAAGPMPANGPRRLRYYQVGLGVIGLFTVILAIVVLVMAGGAKQDTKTEAAANKAATKLDSYITAHQRIPATLSEAGVKDAPSTITYKKISNASYRFCINYKSASSGYNTSSITDVVNRGVYQSDFSSSSYGDYSSGTTSYLYISPTHKKGANCQTVEPYIDTTSFQSQSSIDTVTDPKAAAILSGEQDTVCYALLRQGYQRYHCRWRSDCTYRHPKYHPEGTAQRIIAVR